MTVLDKIEAGEPVEAQELFDYITSKVLEQGRPSILETNDEEGDARVVCVYRGESGAKCAAGHVIPDAWYREELESRAIDGVLEGEPRLEASLAPHLSLLLDLQEAHDNAYRGARLCSTFTAEFIRRATRVAEAYNLNHAFEV
jgi:hypothetical protein